MMAERHDVYVRQGTKDLPIEIEDTEGIRRFAAYGQALSYIQGMGPLEQGVLVHIGLARVIGHDTFDAFCTGVRAHTAVDVEG